MKKYKYTILGFVIGLGIAITTVASGASVFFPYQGGTGTGTAPTAGQVLIGTSGGVYSPANLTAGTNITISTSSGAITINSTASGSGSVSTSSAPTAYNFPYWANSTGGLNGTSTLFYASSTGSIGIANTDPQYALDVTGTGNFSVGIRTPAISNLTSNGFVKTSGGAGTLSIDTNTYLNASNNLSDLTSTSSARTNLGLTDTATLASSTWFKVANNLSEGTASTIRSNLGLGVFATQSAPCTIAQGCLATTTTPSADSYLVGDGTNYQFKKFVAGTNITIATSSTSTTISASGGSPGGSDTYVQYNNGGSFGGDSNFTYTSSTKSVKIGDTFYTTVSSTTKSYTGATSSWVVPTGVTSVTINVKGGGGGVTGSGAGGTGGSSTGTLAVSPGDTLYYAVGGTGSGATGGFPDGGDGRGANPGGGGGGMSWVSTSSSFSTGTVLIVAGGGGGGMRGGSSAGGCGGGLTGCAGAGGSGPGGGGTQSAGGASGNLGYGATAGDAGVGGLGATTYGGAGGASGYYGGGGSYVDAGGGGSGYISPSLTNATTTQSGGATSTNNGSVTFSYTLSSPMGNYILATGGKIISGGSNATTTSCGTTPSNTGNDTAGSITTGSGTVNSCTLTFSSSYNFAPICVANTAATSTQVVINSVSVSSVTFNFSASYPSSKVYYHCLGY